MGRRVARVVTVFAAAIATVAIYAVAPNLLHDRFVFGTFATTGVPPRVDYYGRRYYPGTQTFTRAQINAFLTQIGAGGLTLIDTAPSGMPVVANVMTPGAQSQYRTNICTMEVWVQKGADAYTVYELSGGP